MLPHAVMGAELCGGPVWGVQGRTGAPAGAMMEWEIRPGIPQLERKWEQSPQRDREAVVVPSNGESQQAWGIL